MFIVDAFVNKQEYSPPSQQSTTPMTAKKRLVIRSDADAWKLISTPPDEAEQLDVEFEGWPVLGIQLKGDDYQSSLNSGQMSALVELKMVMGRAYCVVAHGAYDMRRLRSEEEEQLQFTTKVKRGSSILDTDFTPLVKAFGSAISAYPGLSLVAAVLLGLALVAKPIILKYYEDRAKQLDSDERKRLLDLSLSADDKEKVRLFDEASKRVEKRYPQFTQVLPDARASFWRFASASVDADRMSIAGLEMSQDDLELLSERRGRRSSDLQEVTGKFKVVSVRKAGAGFKVGLESKALVIGALYRKPQLSDARIKRLMGYMATDTKVHAVLQVRTVDQAQLSGRLMKFTPLPDDVLDDDDVSSL